MSTSAIIYFFFSFSIFLLYFPIPVTSQEDCPIHQCNKNEPIIRFPFRIEGAHQQKRCGYPGFDLSCNSRNQTVIELSFSGQFFVQNINYATKSIQIYDPDNCLPRRLANLNLSGSPFKGEYHEKYEYLNCSSQIDSGRYGSLFTPISCLSSTTYTVLVTDQKSVVNMMWSCESIANVSVPRTYDFFIYEFEVNDLRLTWGAPNCNSCEILKKKCGFLGNTSSRLGCFGTIPPGPRQGLSKGNIITVSIGIGLVILICFILCALIGFKGHGGVVHDSRNHPSHVELPVDVLAHHQSIIMMTGGVDETTLLSYPKVIIGESRRLPNPQDTTCSICLSEYRPKETVKSIPECNHCFHGDCIDEWLRKNATCPVCRNSHIQ